ncbi:MAG: hypothetical protein ACM3O9_05080 [Methylocystaceae bacterium]
MTTRRVISLLLLALLLMGCSNNHVGTDKPSPASVSTQGVDHPKTPTRNNAPIIYLTSDEPRPSTLPENNHPVPIKLSEPVIIQSDPELAKDTEAVLEDIRKELTSLTEVLSGLEEPDTAWNQEVSKP